MGFVIFFCCKLKRYALFSCTYSDFSVLVLRADVVAFSSLKRLLLDLVNIVSCLCHVFFCFSCLALDKLLRVSKENAPETFPPP